MDMEVEDLPKGLGDPNLERYTWWRELPEERTIPFIPVIPHPWNIRSS